MGWILGLLNGVANDRAMTKGHGGGGVSCAITSLPVGKSKLQLKNI